MTIETVKKRRSTGTQSITLQDAEYREQMARSNAAFLDALRSYQHLAANRYG